MGKIDKKGAIAVLFEMAKLLEMKDENFFKIRAFRNGARLLESLPDDLSSLIESGDLEKQKGIGKGLSVFVRELYETGTSKDCESLRAEFPETLFELFKIPGLGAKRIGVLYRSLKVASLHELEEACVQKRLSSLEGFGEKTEIKLLEEIQRIQK